MSYVKGDSRPSSNLVISLEISKYNMEDLSSKENALTCYLLPRIRPVDTGRTKKRRSKRSDSQKVCNNR